MAAQLNVVHMGSAHPSDDIRIFQKECCTLADAGYKVVFVAQDHTDRIVNGVQVRAAQKTIGRFGRFTKTMWDMLAIALKEDADIYHLHGPDLIPMGIFLKSRGKKVFYDVHEDFPAEITTKYWIPKVIRRPVAAITHAVETLGAKIFDAVIAATPAIAKSFPQEKTLVIRNFPRLEDLPSGIPIPYSSRPNNIAYVGGITSVKCAREMVKAMELIPKSEAVSLLMVGRFENAHLEREVQSLEGWSQVEYKGWCDKQQVNQILGTAKAGLVIFAYTPNHVRAEPNKLFEYMAAGLPVIASDFPYWKELVNSIGAGITVAPDSPQEIADAILWLLAHSSEAEEMGKNGAKAVMDAFNWNCEKRKLLDLYERHAGH